MAESIDELTINYTDPESGTQTVQELDKKVLTRGSWTTIVYLFQEWDRKNECWGKTKARIERYQKRGGHYRSQSRFNISSAKQARAIVEALGDWFPPGGDDEGGGDEE